MQELVQIVNRYTNGEFIPTVSARHVAEFLDVKKDFTSWIKVQIQAAYLKENQDYLIQ